MARNRVNTLETLVAREEYDRLRKQGHSPKHIAKAAELLERVKRGELSEAEASAMLHGRPIPMPTVLDQPELALPKQTVAQAMEEFEAAFDAIIEEP